MPNRLAGEHSLYLRQHADNPVDWYPWGEEALAAARQQDKPILLSIGYSACHWCHVMAHESFENPVIAALMNTDFVCIKVDREERPDIDTIYMDAVQAMTGGGGWPLTVFLTPDARPFYGGTYFPPEDRAGMPGFPRVLGSIASAYRTRRGELLQGAQALTAALLRTPPKTSSTGLLSAQVLIQAYEGTAQAYDRTYGGFGRAPKFPQPLILEYLLRYHYRSGDALALEMVSQTLKAMASGGIYDQLGGGFHRYSTDQVWLAPHFEKMLYDNALLARLYLHAWMATGEERFRQVVEETLDFVLRELRDPLGGFYSTLDADSEGQEGKFYLWTQDEIHQILGEPATSTLSAYYGITTAGNFEGRNILHLPNPKAQTPADLAGYRARLLAAREERARPGRDQKVIAGWNGLMLAALVEAGVVLNRSDFLQAAEACGQFILDGMCDNTGRLLHVYQDGAARIPGFLEDYGAVIDGLLSLHSATLAGRWLAASINLGSQMVEEFWDGTGGFYDTGIRHEELISRPRSTFDGATPSGPAAAAFALLHLATVTGNQDWRRIAATSLGSMATAMQQQPLGHGHWLCALDYYLDQPLEMAIVGWPQHPTTRRLLNVAHRVWGPNRVIAGLDPDDPEPLSSVALLENKLMMNGQPTAYLCQGYQCQAPTTNPTALEGQINKFPIKGTNSSER
jgi:hypothetical protein